MDNKVLVELNVPSIDEIFNVFLPCSKKIGNIIVLLNKSLNDITNGSFKISDSNFLYNKATGEKYDINIFLKDSSIKNGTRLVLY